MRVFVDSDVLIWHLRGMSEAKNRLRVLIETEGLELWIGAMQRAEIVFFMQEEEEKATSDLLSLFKTDPIDQSVVDLAGKLYKKWNPSHGIDPNDALLAAAVALRGGKIMTLNTSHYPMPEIVVERAWPEQSGPQKRKRDQKKAAEIRRETPVKVHGDVCGWVE